MDKQIFDRLKVSMPLQRAIQELNILNLTPIQEKAFPVIMSGKDAVAISQTGTGKTFAYLLPILQQHVYSEQRHPRVLIVVPTRELVVQVVEDILKLAKYITIRVLGVYGASNINTQKQKVYEGQDVLVATPGRLIDLTLSRTLQLSAIRKFVIDEMDEMLNLGFRPQLMQIMEKLPPRRQNILFSATLTEEVELMINKNFDRPEYIELVSRGTPLEKIHQLAYDISNFYTKVNLLKWMLQHEKSLVKILLFVKNKTIADFLEKELQEYGDDIGVIHSNKSQPHRFDMVKRFEAESLKLLIATDVVARGLDFKDVSHVINFDLPAEPGTYLHRIGRTGRAHKAGTAISFVTGKESGYKTSIEQLMDKKLQMVDIPTAVELSDDLIPEELPMVRDKNLKKTKPKATPSGAFHEKKAKNKKVQLGGKRRQEKQRRALEKSRSKRRH